ncbi:MAG: glycosyltransferase family 2 protein [Clostridia bacterium]|nr:glycosyltransferase family 2 protein [Clostridia bacterium]
MERPLISVMVPCYNTAKYLAKCIESILNQTYKNIELIILSDGSTDGSVDIMKKYAKKDERITVIDRDNKGVAISRNELIENAKGDYLMYVDSDDTISEFMLEDMYNALIKNEADIVMCPAYIVHEDTDIAKLPMNRNCEQETITNVQALFNMISLGDFYHYPVAKLYTRKSLKDIVFPANREYEDSATVFKIYYNIDKAVVLKQPYYYYLVGRENSITTKKYTMKNLKDNYLAIKERYDFITEKVPELESEAKFGYIRNIFTLLSRVYLANDEEQINSDIVKEVEAEIPKLYESAKNYKNVEVILDKYKLACIYLMSNGKKQDYINILKFIDDARKKSRE